jgi:hypothetical protein
MDTVLSLEHLEVLENGFEISKILAHAGYHMDQPAFAITWGRLAEMVASCLSENGLSVGNLPEYLILELVTELQCALVRDEILELTALVGQYITAQPEIEELLQTRCEPFDNDDEGPLTDQYENACRSLDDEAYWPDGGVSAGFGEDY